MSQQSAHPLERFAQASRATGIRRPQRGRWVAGVASGIALRYQIDPVIVRVAFILTLFVSGIGLPTYLFAWALLPAEDGSVALERGFRQGQASAILLCVAAAASLSGLGASGDGVVGSIWGLLIVGAVGWLLLRRHQQHVGANGPAQPPGVAPTPVGSIPAGGYPQPGAPNASTPAPFPHTAYPLEEHRHDPAVGVGHAPAPTVTPEPVEPRRGVGWFATLLALGASILAYVGTMWTVQAAGTGGDSHVFGLIAVLAVCSLTLVGVGIRGHRAPLVTIATWFLGAVLAASTLPGAQLSGMSVVSVPDTGRRWDPTTAEQLADPFDIGVGEATLDLTGLPEREAAKAKNIELDHGTGSLTIIVPSSYGTQVLTDIGVGQVTVVRGDSRTTLDPTEIDSDKPRTLSFGTGNSVLTINAELGIGSLTIVEKDTP
ncbi:PspC domain-containing protein [Gephyromycinifex aptenodytis]|uniref:PspC domain-containing protein n=1 Tax=Gephyromycinifex aptenodytis TaxID=2716227 RepID=UPI0014459B4D|nr:PspC domain-containing protein [Gephyromycinifex aptenodytis]